MRKSASGPELGLRANWTQFWLLVLVNAFVGAMVGLERTVLPLIAERASGLASRTATLSFLVAFGLVKAVSNLFAGRLGDRFGRKRILVAGWVGGPAGAFPRDLGTGLVVDRCGKRAPRDQPGAHLVHHGLDENRPRGSGAARIRHGSE